MANSDFYSALIGAPVDSQEKQAALADLLRRRAGFANVAQMTGDPVLAAQGQQQAQVTADQSQQLLRGALAARQEKMAREQATQEAADRQTRFGLERSAQALTERGQNLDYESSMARLLADQAKANAPKPPTDAQAGARAYLGRMQAAEGLLGGYSPTTKDFVAASSIYGGGGALTSALASNVMSEEGQKYYQAAADWVRAKLRKESGAAIGKEEMAQEIRTYFPMPGESQAQIEQKAAARKQAEAEMATMGGMEAPPVTKTIGGKTYTKRGGKWYAD